MLTVDFARFPVGPGDRVLDLGCGAGRHAFEVYRRGADVVALDRDADELQKVDTMFAAMAAEGQAPAAATAETVHGDALALPFPDGAFTRVIASEVMEHVPDDAAAMREVFRVTAPGGLVAVTVPRWFPELVCWGLSDEYHEVEGGHVRIYRRRQLLGRLRSAGFEPRGHDHTHGLHSPYWWVKCALGVSNDQAPLARAFHRLLVWDLMEKPRVTRWADAVLDPLVGKSLVVYLRKPEASAGSARAAA